MLTTSTTTTAAAKPQSNEVIHDNRENKHEEGVHCGLGYL